MARGAEGSAGVGSCGGDSHGLAQPLQLSVAVREGFDLVFQLLSVPWNMIKESGTCSAPLWLQQLALVTQGASTALSLFVVTRIGGASPHRAAPGADGHRVTPQTIQKISGSGWP